MNQNPLPRVRSKKAVASLEAYHTSLTNELNSLRLLFNTVVGQMEPNPPCEALSGDDELDRFVSEPVSKADVGVQVGDARQADGSPVTIVPEVRAGNVTINVDSSSADESENVPDVDSKAEVLIESLKMKSMSFRNGTTEDRKNLLHYVVIENLPPSVTRLELERDVFDLVDIDGKLLSLNIQRKKTEGIVQIYTKDMRQVEKILACDRKVVVGGRVIASRIGTCGPF